MEVINIEGLKFKDLEEVKIYKHIGYENLYAKKEGLLFRVDYNDYADFSNADFILGMRFIEIVEKESIPCPICSSKGGSYYQHNSSEEPIWTECITCKGKGVL